ncbi:LamB/YcsF family protein [Streptomyces sp. NPDC059837]|uniref:LamB/YcsF family protein n=1 Tax=Streptomyces sp. NPDC059837 TaxID=3346968 RepID=UPI003647F72E
MNPDAHSPTLDGTDVEVACDTVLLHGDSPGAIALASRVRAQLLAAGVEITSLDKVLSGKGV